MSIGNEHRQSPPQWPSKRGLPQSSETELIPAATLLSTKAKLWRLGSLPWKLNAHAQRAGTTSLHRHQYNSPHSPAGSKLCSLPRLTPKQTLGSAAQPQADSRLVPHRSHSYHNEPLHNLPSTKEYPRHSIHGYPIAQMNCWMPLQPFRVTSSPLFHGIKHYNLHAALDHSCWEIWPWLTPVGAHFHIPATGSSNLILHLESIICFISITCLNHNFAVFGEGRRVRPNSYLSKNSFKFLFKHLRTRPTWIHPLPQKFHLVSCPA